MAYDFAVTELVEYITDNTKFRTQYFNPIRVKLESDIKSGSYDPKIALSMWSTLLGKAVTYYVDEHRDDDTFEDIDMRTIFPQAVLDEAAQILRDRFESKHPWVAEKESSLIDRVANRYLGLTTN